MVSDEATKNVWASISIIEPHFKTAKINVTVTHENKLIEAALMKYRSPIKD